MRYQKLFAGILIISFISGCASVQGYTRNEKRDNILSMKNEVLEELYEIKPEAREKVEESSGYAVFSNINMHFFLISSGGGYGVVTNKKTGEETFMKMFNLGAGPGFGAKDFRAVIVFDNEADLTRFAQGGWDFSGEADAAAKSKEKGASATGIKAFDSGITIYQLTEAGLLLQASLQGTKYYPYRELN